jgi:Fic family protein
LIIFELTQTENHPAYQALEIQNAGRQYDFIKSIVPAAIAMQRPFLSEHVIKALNFQAITCLHTNAGQYRPCKVMVGDYEPPAFYRVDALMEDFVNSVNRGWESMDAVLLATFVLWRLNHIHPFINGNGRTARAAAYYVLCLKVGGLLPGEITLPELLKRDRPDYTAALKAADTSLTSGTLDLSQLHALMMKLLTEQLGSASSNGAPPTDSPAPRSMPRPLRPSRLRSTLPLMCRSMPRPMSGQTLLMGSSPSQWAEGYGSARSPQICAFQLMGL